MGNLIKYEWKHVSKRAVFALLYLVVLTALACIASNISSINLGIVRGISGIILFLYVTTLSVIAFVVYIYIGERFRINLYGNEGYLMQSLPFSKSSLIFAKGFVAFIWSLLLLLASSVSFLIFVLASSLDGFVNRGQLISDIDLDAISRAFKEEFSFSFGLTVILAVLLAFAIIVALINMMYAAVCIGQLWARHTTAGTVLAYLLLLILYFYCIVGAGYSLSYIAADVPTLGILILLVMHLLWAGIGFAVSALLMRYRLNLN